MILFMLSGIAVAARVLSTRYSFRACNINSGKRFELSLIEFFVCVFSPLGTERKKSRERQDFETIVPVI